jgi:hypothetical protein
MAKSKCPRAMACTKFYVHLVLAALMLSLGGGCATTSLLNNPAVPGEEVAGEGTVVGSFVVEPVPQWSNPPEQFWLSVWRTGWGADEYTITLRPGQEEYVVKHMPAGTYNVRALYAGNPGFTSRGHGRKGVIRKVVQFDVHEKQMTYIGRLQLTLAKEPDHIRAWRKSLADSMLRKVSILTGKPMMSTSTRPIMYVETTVEESRQAAMDILRRKGWKPAEMDRIETSLMINQTPEEYRESNKAIDSDEE